MRTIHAIEFAEVDEITDLLDDLYNNHEVDAKTEGVVGELVRSFEELAGVGETDEKEEELEECKTCEGTGEVGVS